MFLKTLENQTTPEQKKLWYEPAMNYEILGAYGQTELGHGSNVRGLETTATYFPETQEWELHTPTLTAAKFWIGTLGRIADHSVVMAQLITNGKSYGVHPFIIPIRDMKTRQPLPGRIVGDIGPKSGFGFVDNGMLILDHVRVPHINMLAAFSQVDKKSGAYIKPLNDKLSYATMVFIRSGIVQNAGMVLARAATVAVRYCALRRQFADKDIADNGAGEIQVLDYQMVQARIFPVLVQALASQFTGRQMFKLYEDNQRNITQGDLSLLADTHASSSGLKSVCSIMAAEGIETCRRACGGHGFSLASGLGSLYTDCTALTVSYSRSSNSDSYMLTQQCARYLLATYRNVTKAPTAPTVNVTQEYMSAFIRDPSNHTTITSSSQLRDPAVLTAAFAHRAAFQTARIARLQDKGGRKWNSLLVDLFKLSNAHCQFVLVKNWADTLRTDETLAKDPKLSHVMKICFALFAEFMVSGFTSLEGHELVEAEVVKLLSEMRPQAVALVDGFALPDYLLNSALGQFSGDAYKSMLDFASREPLNGVTFNPRYREEELVVGEGAPRSSKL
ncbi:acyl-CoA oxidase, partial [Phenoliferia sp. Uapishka_3]